MKSEKVLVAGATGYLGQYLVKELKKRGFWTRVLIRHEHQKEMFDGVDDFFVGQVTDFTTLQGITKDIHWVFSAVGITRQKDGFTYMDVDYKGNVNLLRRAMEDGVSSFQYISAIGGDKLRQLKIFEAKEKFVDDLKNSGMNYCIIRPNGFFSDMKDFLDMAKSGRVYLFGDGHYQLNPIDGEDLAIVCVDTMIAGDREVTVGGAEIFSQNELAALALKAWGKDIKIIHLPDWIRKFTIWFMRVFTSSKTYGPIEFFLTAMAQDIIADPYGKKRLENFFNEEVKRRSQP